ncbi:porin [Massilia niastensis]|uniref:porin n=1 Tax=Massilia niastensis TaxID=544911 RepID=UPI00036608D1|nr:porin [Massilia niastensis]
MKKFIAGITALSASAVSMAQPPAAPPAAQASSVRVYGVADIAVARYRTSDATKTAMHAGGSGSRIGFLATEDLGQGWRVNARLEAGVNLDAGTSSSTNGNPNRVWSRQVYVEMGHKSFGALKLGRLQGPTYNFFPTYDPMLLPAMDAWGVLSTLGSAAPGTASGTGVSTGFLINPTFRSENTVNYTSPRIGGVQAEVSYSLNEGSLTQPKVLEAGLDYLAGPFQIGALFVKAGSTPGSGAARPTDSVAEAAIGAKFVAGPIQPYLTYIRRDLTDQTLGATGSVLNGRTETVKLLGAVIPVSARGSVRMTWGRYDSGTPDRDARSYGVAYTYDVSRRLMLMAAYTHLSQGLAASWPVFQSPKPLAGDTVEGFTVGATWRF